MRNLTSKKLSPDIVCITLLFAMTAVFFSPFWLQHKVFVPADILGEQQPWAAAHPDAKINNPEAFDAVQQHLPWRMFYKRSIAAGEVPLWNPHQFCGAPFAANDQSAIFYPINLVMYGLLPADIAYTLNAWLHLFLAGLFMYLLLRFERAGGPGGMLGAVVFMFNGCSAVWMQHAAKQSAMTWTPLVLLLAGIALRRGNRRAAVLCGAVTAMLLTAGFLQYASYALFALVLYLIYNVALRPRDVALCKNALIAGGTALALGAAIAAVHLWPVLELAAQSGRPRVLPHNGWFPGLPLDFALNIISPNRLGSPVGAAANSLGFNFTEATFFVPVAALLLGFYALVNAARKECSRDERSAAAFYLILAAFGFTAMFGTPVYAVYYYLVPGAKTLAVARIGYLFIFGVSVLTGLGAGALVRRLTRRWTAGAERNIKTMIITLSATFPLVIIVNSSLMPWGMKFNTFVDRDTVFPQTITTKLLLDADKPVRIFSGDPELPFFPDAATAYGIDDARGYDSLYPQRYRDFMQSLQDNWGPGELRGKRRATTIAEAPGVFAAAPLDWINIQYIITAYKMKLPWYEPVPGAELNIYRNGRAYPRVFFSRGFAVENDAKKTLAKITSKKEWTTPGAEPFKPEKSVILEKEPDFLRLPKSNDRDEKISRSSVKVVKQSSGGMELEVAAPRNLMLFISNTYYPGWQASIDGAPTEVLRANYTFQAVAMPAGKHRLKIWFSPKSTRAGLAISLLALSFAFGMLLLISNKCRK